MKRNSENNKVAPFWVTFMAGGISGTIGAVITNPLEVVKTRMQSSMYQPQILATNGIKSIPFRSAPLKVTWMHITGTLGSLKGIYTNEGIAALWKGMGATIIGVMPARAIYFSTYTQSKQFLSNLNNGKESSLIHLTSALLSGIVTSTATNPIWLVKTRMQLQQSSTTNDNATIIKGGERKLPIYKNSLDCIRQVARTEGIRGLYKGMTASYLGSIEGTIQWVLYEKLKKSISQHRHRTAGTEYRQSNASNSMTWLDFFLTAASAKLVAAVVAYPHEVFRTRLREDNNKYRGLLQTAIRIVREEGIIAWYGGMTAHLMRVVPNSAIMFFCYEFLIHSYAKLDL